MPRFGEGTFGSGLFGGDFPGLPKAPPQFALQVRAYVPNGAPLGVLPDALSVTASMPLMDRGALTIEGSHRLIQGNVYRRGFDEFGIELAVEVKYRLSSGLQSEWIEPHNSRFIALGRQQDRADPAGSVSLTCPAYSWLLGRAIVLSSFERTTTWSGNNIAGMASSTDDMGRVQFNDCSPGDILTVLINEAKARDALPGLSVNFTAERDSSNALWGSGTRVTASWERGTSLLQILDNLADHGLVDWAMQGRELRLFNPDTTFARDRHTVDGVGLRERLEVVESPNRQTYENVLTRIHVRGDDGVTTTRVRGATPRPWGHLEGFMQASGASTVGMAQRLADAELEKRRRSEVEMTRGLTFEGARFLPFRDFRPGDFILARYPQGSNPAGEVGPVRVRQITVSRDKDGLVTGNVVLNSRHIEAVVKRERRDRGITSGATLGGSGGLTSVKRTAAADAIGSASVTFSGSASASVTVTFPAGRFSRPPYVTASLDAGTTQHAFTGSSDRTASSATLHFRRIDGASVTGSLPFLWEARQMSNVSTTG